MYLMHCLRQLDVWPVADLNVREGFGLAWRIDPTPTAFCVAMISSSLRRVDMPVDGSIQRLGGQITQRFHLVAPQPGRPEHLVGQPRRTPAG